MNTRQQATNTFTGGLVTDSQPLVTPSNVLTDCLNGTIITHNGNEYTLQNDSGNKKTEGVLPEGYIPLASKEYNGILYIISAKEEEDSLTTTEIGCFPSPSEIAIDSESISRDKSYSLFSIGDDSSSLKSWYSYDEINNACNSIRNVSIEEKKYYAIQQTNTLDFLDIYYNVRNNNNKQENPKIIYEEGDSNNQGVLTDDEVRNDLRYTSNKLLVDITTKVITLDTSISYNLWTNTDRTLINGSIKFQCKPSKELNSASKIKGAISINMNGEASPRVDNSYWNKIGDVYEYEIKWEDEPCNKNINVEVNVAAILESDCGINIKYSTISKNININDLITNNLRVFESFYYYHINEATIEEPYGSIDIYFDATKHSEKIISNISCKLYKLFLNSSDPLTEITDGSIEVAYVKDNLYKAHTQFRRSFMNENIYVFEIQDTNNKYRKLLITSECFNNFFDETASELDFSTIEPSLWMTQKELTPVNTTISLGRVEKSIVTNDTSLEWRKYVTGVKLDGSDIPKLNKAYIANYIPYIDSTSYKEEDLELRAGIRSTASVEFNDSLQISGLGLWNNLSGSHTVTFTNTKSGVIDEAAQELKILWNGDHIYNNQTSDKLYSEDGYKISVTEEDTIANGVVLERKYFGNSFYSYDSSTAPSDNSILQISIDYSYEEFSATTLDVDSTNSKGDTLYLISLYNNILTPGVVNYTRIADAHLWYTGIKRYPYGDYTFQGTDPKYEINDYTESIQNLTDTILYTYILKGNDTKNPKLFIPVELLFKAGGSGMQMTVNGKSYDVNHNDRYWGLLVIRNRTPEGSTETACFDAELLKLPNSKYITNDESYVSTITSLANVYNSTLYTYPNKYTSISLSKLKLKSPEAYHKESITFTDNTSINSEISITDLYINNTKASIAKNILENDYNINCTNISIEDPIVLYQTVNVNNLGSLKIPNSSSTDGEVLRRISDEMTAFKKTVDINKPKYNFTYDPNRKLFSDITEPIFDENFDLIDETVLSQLSSFYGENLSNIVLSSRYGQLYYKSNTSSGTTTYINVPNSEPYKAAFYVSLWVESTVSAIDVSKIKTYWNLYAEVGHSNYLKHLNYHEDRDI